MYLAPLNFDQLSENFAVVPDTATTVESKTNWLFVLSAVYIAGVLVALLRFLYGLNKLKSIYDSAKVSSMGSIKLVDTEEIHLPFSFFNLLFISKKIGIAGEDKDKIVLHEKAHIEGRHSIDLSLIHI